MFGMMAFVFSNNRYAWWSSAFLEVPEHLPVMGSSEWTPCFALLTRAAFAFHIKLPLSQPTSFVTFSVLIPFIISQRGEWASGCAGLSCALGINLNNCLPQILLATCSIGCSVAECCELSLSFITDWLPVPDKVLLFCHEFIVFPHPHRPQKSLWASCPRICS